MKRLPFILFIFVLICTVLWAQHRVDSTVQIEIGNLVAQENFSELKTRLSAQKNNPSHAEYWQFFGEKTLARAEEYFDLDSFDKTINILNRGLDLLAEVGRSDSMATARFWAWKALTHRRLDQYSNALDAYNGALRIYEKNQTNAPIVAYSYKNAAQICIRQQNYVQANKYLMAALERDSSGRYEQSIYSQLANNAYWQDSLDLAWRYYEKANTLSGGANYRAALQSVGADILIKKRRFEAAEQLTKQALQYFKANPVVGDDRLRCYTSLATIAARQNRAAAAEANYRKAEREGLDWFKQKKSRELAKLYTEWGDFLRTNGQQQRALELYQKALIQVYPDFDNPNPTVNPPAGNPPLELWAMLAPARKAALLLENPSHEVRHFAADCFDLAFAAADRLRRTYGTDEAKLYLSQNNYNLLRESALNLWELYQQSGDPKELNRLFTLLETTRANTLRDALQQQRALALSSVPDSLLTLEEQQRLEIARLEKNAQEAKTDGDSAKVVLLTRELIRMQILYDELFDHLKENYSQFREYLEAGQTASLSKIRDALPPKAALLCWFDAGDRYLCLALQKQNLRAFEVLRDTALDQTLARFQKMLANKTSQETDPATFFADAFFLKKRLLPDSVLTNTEALVLVPDGRLAYLPFEALLTKPHKGAYGSAPYLLRSHSLQYVWSATLLTAKPSAKKTGKQLLQVAPFVETSRDGLALLPNSLREKPEHTTANVLQGNDASADRFLAEAATYEILHLSTHAHAGQKGQPGIEFFDRAVGLPELYAQRLQASLVSLSACETGAGTFAEGEGVLSLARAFAYAGAQSLVASHWSVSERSTANLFAAFYQQLERGLPKSEALRQAKLQLLEQTGPDARKAPFYWAAFTLSGTDGPVDLSGNVWPWWAWALGGFGLVLAGIFFSKKVKSSI